MTLLIQIKSAHLHRDTEVIGAMSPYVVVYDTQGVQLKRTGLKSGKNPVWQNDNFKCLQKLKGLQFLIYDRQNFQKEDDFVGRACMSFADIPRGMPGQPVPVELPLKYQQRNAGRLNLEVTVESDGMMMAGVPAAYSQKGPVYGAGQQIPIANWRPMGPPGVGGLPVFVAAGQPQPQQAQYIPQPQLQPQPQLYQQPPPTPPQYLPPQSYIPASNPMLSTPPRAPSPNTYRVNTPPRTPSPENSIIAGPYQNIQNMQAPVRKSMNTSSNYYILPEKSQQPVQIKGGLERKYM